MNQAPICGIFGRRGVGKTTLAREIARHQARLVVWDYLGEHGPLPFRSEGNLEALGRYLVLAQAQQFAACRYVPARGDVEEFEAFCGVIYRCRDFLLVVEEVAAVCQASYLPPQFGRVVRQGRHSGIGLLWTSQRLAEVSRTLTSLTDCWAGFATAEPADLSALAGRCGREYAGKVAELPRFAWLGFDVDTREGFTDVERLRSLWGAPRVWRLPGSPRGVALASARRDRASGGNGGNIGNISGAARGNTERRKFLLGVGTGRWERGNTGT